MSNKSNPSTAGKLAGGFLQYIRKNADSLFLGTALVVMLVSTDARIWVLRQLMHTGLFNAAINSKDADPAARLSADFDFEDKDGHIRNTAALRGKVVFINFWASWCPPCRAEFPSIETLYRKFKDNPGFVFLTMSEDSSLSVADSYLKKENYTLPFYRTRSKVPEILYNGTLPTTIILDKKGVIRYKKEGFANYSSDAFLKQVEKLIKE